MTSCKNASRSFPSLIVMWRAFVYGNGMVGKEDRARQAADTFLALDGKFDQNVVIQVGAVHSTVVLVLTT